MGIRRLETRVLGAFGILVTALVAVTLVIVHAEMTRSTEARVRSELSQARKNLEELLLTRSEALIESATLIAELPAIQRAVSSWQADDVSRAFREINRLIGSVVIVFTDRMGVVIARSDRRWEPGETFDETTSVARALRGQRATSIWFQEDHLYQMVSVPIRLDSGLGGTLSLGFGVGRELALDMARLSGTEVAFLVDDRVVASSTRPGASVEAAFSELASRLRPTSRAVFGPVEFGGSRPAIVVSPLPGSRRGPQARYALYRSLAPEVEAMTVLERRLLWSAAGGLLVLFAVGFWLSRSITRPLRALASASKELEVGNYAFPLPRKGGSIEIEGLTRAFEAMRRALRTRVRELDEWNVQLEAKVHDRTQRLEAALEENRRLLDELRRWNEELEEKVDRRTREVAEAQRKMLQQDRMAAMGRLAASVAHEINNPLGILSGFAEGLRARAADEKLRQEPAFADFPEYLEMIGHEVDRLEGIVRKFLDFSRSKEPKIETFDALAVVANVAGLLRSRAASEGKRIEVLDGATPVTALADSEQIRQVLVNLALNALDAAPKGGRVALGASESGTDVEIFVEDDGPGIDAELRSRVFEPFFTTKPAGKGTGLGLALCADLVRENGGRIEVEDGAGGRGTRVVVRLRRGAVAPHAAQG